MDMKEARTEWEFEVTIEKDRSSGKWIASDGVDHEVGRTPQEALEDLWIIAEARILEENREMYAEMKEDEYAR